ncbi:MAG TPA: hypothetical protein VG733_11120 [Chthoniobacteraceae bacterium]|nr:hypothetical protein [Chthoniobacteraceae bacterium]
MKVGNASVRILRYPGVNRFWYRDPATGKRKFVWRVDLQEAKDEASLLATRIESGRQALHSLTTADHESYLQALRDLKPLDLPLHAAIAELVQARKKLAGAGSLIEAAEYFARHRPQNKPRAVADVVDELLERRKADGKSQRYLQTLRSHLHRFRTHFEGNISSFPAESIDAWLEKLRMPESEKPISLRTRNNIRMSIVTLFHFARSKGYLPRGIATVADQIERQRAEASPAKVYSPAEMQKIIEAAQAIDAAAKAKSPRGGQVLPAIGIAAFAGVRAATIARMTWQNIKWSAGKIEIPAEISKTRRRYQVPLLPNLAALLGPHRGRTGRITAGMRLEAWMREVFTAAGVKRLNNGFRDSFISYRVAQTEDLPKVAYEAGNSVEMIRSKYLDVRTKGEAKLWFDLPAREENLILFKQEENA